MEVEKLLDFLHLMEKMKCNTRHCDTSTGRRESVAEHSWRLCMMAFLVRDAFLDLDMDRVLKMCLIHDIGEAVTGDIPAFDKNSVHEWVESQAIDWLLSLLSGSVRQDMEALSGAKVILQCWVKVKEDCRNRQGLLNSFGYKL